MESEEFKSIEIAGPGFLNISFHLSFWNQYLTKIVKLDSKYGKEFEKAYHDYESTGLLEDGGLIRKQLPAQELWNKIIEFIEKVSGESVLKSRS